MRRPGLALRVAAGVLAALGANASVASGAADARAVAGVVDAITVVHPSPLLAAGRGASVILRATFVEDGVYADPRVVETQVTAGALEAHERERLEREALRAFSALRKWRFRASPDAVLPAPGSPITVRVQFVTMPETPRRD